MLQKEQLKQLLTDLIQSYKNPKYPIYCEIMAKDPEERVKLEQTTISLALRRNFSDADESYCHLREFVEETGKTAVENGLDYDFSRCYAKILGEFFMGRLIS